MQLKVTVWIVAAAVLLTSCRERSTAVGRPVVDRRVVTVRQPRLVVLYATCTLNEEYVSPFNPAVAYTPHLAKFARAAVVFTKHRTEAGMSGIAFASLFTGRQAPGHGIFRHPTKMAGAVLDVTQGFAAAGYEAFYWDAQPMSSADLNYAKGVRPENVFRRRLRFDDDAFRKILDRVRTDPAYKAVLVTNLTVTHGPYVADHLPRFCSAFPDQCAVRRELAQHDFDRLVRLYQEEDQFQVGYPQTVQRLRLTAEESDDLGRVVELLYKSTVWVLDEWFGAVVDEIDRAALRNTSLIVFTADHGEILSARNVPFRWAHGMNLEGAVLDVPLLMRLDGLRPQHVDAVTRSIDVFPTMASLASVPLSTGVDGEDLSQALLNDEPLPRLLAFSHTGVLPDAAARRPDHMTVGLELAKLYPDGSPERIWVAVRDRDFVVKYERNSDGRFSFRSFDLTTDPEESRDVFDADDPRQRSLASKLKDYRTVLIQSFENWESARRNSGNLLPDEDAARRLRSLGYIR